MTPRRFFPMHGSQLATPQGADNFACCVASRSLRDVLWKANQEKVCGIVPDRGLAVKPKQRGTIA